MLDPVLKLNPLDDVWQAIWPGYLSPLLLGWHPQPEDHSEGGLSGQASLSLACAVSNRGKDAFDRAGVLMCFQCSAGKS